MDSGLAHFALGLLLTRISVGPAPVHDGLVLHMLRLEGSRDKGIRDEMRYGFSIMLGLTGLGRENHRDDKGH